MWVTLKVASSKYEGTSRKEIMSAKCSFQVWRYLHAHKNNIFGESLHKTPSGSICIFTHILKTILHDHVNELAF